MVFVHRPKIGDVIYSLPFIREVSKGEPVELWLDPVSPYFMGQIGLWNFLFTDLARYLRKLPYIETVNVGRPKKYDYDLDMYMHTTHLTKGDTISIVDNHFIAFGLEPKDYYDPWLIGKSVDCVGIGVSRSFNHHSSKYKPISGDLFIGLHKEHDAYYPSIQMAKTHTFEDLVNAVFSLDEFHGNQSAPLAIASGLGIKRYIEECDNYPNCRVNSGEGFELEFTIHG